jgi:hypothetical protein
MATTAEKTSTGYIINKIQEEILRAEAKHPKWPKDIIHASAIVGEESGELIRAALQLSYEGGDTESVRIEAIQTAATCIRLLKNL